MERHDEWVQKAPDDIAASHMGVDTYVDRNHHAGMGLWQLTKLTKYYGGSLWIWSGDSSIFIDTNGKIKRFSTDITWKGVAIELEFNIERARKIAETANTRSSDSWRGRS